MVYTVTDQSGNRSRLTADQERVLSDIEWEFTAGQSFGIGEEDVVRWLMEHGWLILWPPGFQRTDFDDFPENQTDSGRCPTCGKDVVVPPESSKRRTKCECGTVVIGRTDSGRDG